MAIDHIKKQAKRLSRLLPAHLATYPDPSALSACQELAAQSNGYPSFHAATSKSEVVVDATTLTGDGELRQHGAPGEYSTLANPKALQSGVIEYLAKGATDSSKGQYWIVDVGFSLKYHMPLTMMFFSPSDADDRLAVDGQLREHVFAEAILDASRQDDSYTEPVFVVLVMKPAGQPLYGLCFHILRLATLNGSAVLDGCLDSFDMKTVLQPYDRFVLREVIHTLVSADIKSPQVKVQPRASKDVFLHLLGRVLAIKQVVLPLRRAGFDLSLRDDSWMLDTMLDVQRFDKDIATLLANIALPETGQTPFVRRSSLGSHQVVYGSTGATKASLSQGDLLSYREIERDPTKTALFQEFTKVVAWGYDNRVDSIDWVLDNYSSRSQVYFCIDRRYIKLPEHVIPTETMSNMLGVAWQLSAGGSSVSFDDKIEQQSQITMKLPATPQRPNDARIRLQWSGIPNEHGTTVTMGIQHLGGSEGYDSLSEEGYLRTVNSA